MDQLIVFLSHQSKICRNSSFIWTKPWYLEINYGVWITFWCCIARESKPSHFFPKVIDCKDIERGKTSLRTESVHWINSWKSLYRIAYVWLEGRFRWLLQHNSNYIYPFSWSWPHVIFVRTGQKHKHVWQIEDFITGTRTGGKGQRKYPIGA